MGNWNSGLLGTSERLQGTTQTCSSQKQGKEGLRLFTGRATEQSRETFTGKIQEALGFFWTTGRTCGEVEGKRVPFQIEVRTHMLSS